MEPKDKKKYSLEDLFHEKEKIEKSINEQFQEYVTIMFTDIAGYTSFVETHGDIAAKSLLQKHNEIIFSIIEIHSGNVIKTIGDAIMASFSDTKNAVIAAVDIQKALTLHNKKAEKIKKINIRIGIHAGDALKDGNDYFGDAVNIAARIEPTGSAGQIMVSKSVYTAVKDNKNIFCSYHGLKEAKGKSRPLEVYRVFLNHEEQVSREDGKTNLGEIITSTAKPVTHYNLMWKVSLPFVLIMVLLFIYPGFLTKINTSSNGIIEKYMDGFMYLRNGDFTNARKKFMEIGEDDSRSREGLAALAYRNRAYDTANQLSEKSLALNTGSLYPRVIKGNILFDNGKYDEAKQLYKEATNLDTAIKWQKGEAFFRLGRISSFQDNSSKALEYYNQAITYDEQNTDIITAKGVLLEKMGKLTQALELFRTAQKLAPNDAFVNAFHKSIQQKIEAGQDKEKQERIDTLIDKLITNMKENKTFKLSDRWTSRPVTLFFAKMQRKGSIPLREGQDEFFKLEMTERLRQLPAVNVVDRELLDKLLQELKMSSSDLADTSTALELGRIISARLIGNLTFIGLKNETRLYLKLIETETSAIKISLSETFDNDSDLDDIVNTIITRISKKLQSSFPVRGKISSMDGSMVRINIGSDIGVQNGMVMRVFSNAKDRKLVGAVKVVFVEPDKARCEIIKGQEKINAQYLLEAAAL
jgi:class 3 adenylate cyclase/tetratricopeptide (TPR) repeat protein